MICRDGHVLSDISMGTNGLRLSFAFAEMHQLRLDFASFSSTHLYFVEGSFSIGIADSTRNSSALQRQCSLPISWYKTEQLPFVEDIDDNPAHRTTRRLPPPYRRASIHSCTLCHGFIGIHFRTATNCKCSIRGYSRQRRKLSILSKTSLESVSAYFLSSASPILDRRQSRAQWRPIRY